MFSNVLCVNEPVVAERQWAEDSIFLNNSEKVQAPDSVIAYIYIYVDMPETMDSMVHI